MSAQQFEFFVDIVLNDIINMPITVSETITANASMSVNYSLFFNASVTLTDEVSTGIQSNVFSANITLTDTIRIKRPVSLNVVEPEVIMVNMSVAKTDVNIVEKLLIGAKFTYGKVASKKRGVSEYSIAIIIVVLLILLLLASRNR